jgi:hypothetical protein
MVLLEIGRMPSTKPWVCRLWYLTATSFATMLISDSALCVTTFGCLASN